MSDPGSYFELSVVETVLLCQPAAGITLAVRQKNYKEYQAKPIKGATLEAIVERYNSFVDSSKDRAREFRNLSSRENWQARK